MIRSPLVIVQRLSSKIQEELKKGFLHQQNQRFHSASIIIITIIIFSDAEELQEELQAALLVK
jgi:hypothetical protein